MGFYRNCLMLAGCLLSALSFLGSGVVAASELPPNVVIMMADDMGLGDTSAYQDLNGNSDESQILTPNMERLARLGVRMTDAHTPSSRCSPTRYGLITGRYPWRNRLKHWVLFGAQGDPMIERDRPTIATQLQDFGYHTGMVGKWHVGLRFRKSDDHPADGWDDADLKFPLYDTPLDHGFDECIITSRSHGTSGPKSNTRQNTSEQTVGPGHIEGRTAIGATGNGKQLVESGPNAYILEDLGGRHSDHAIDFLNRHLKNTETAASPFFLYYACNSNHSPYTPVDSIDGQPVKGESRSVAGQKMGEREDFVYENDVALGRLIDYLENTPDPRRPGHSLVDNTLVIFTSDNGAEKNRDTATGRWRSNKGSCYEGGHRVPFIAACPAAGIGDGNDETPGLTNESLICLTDLMATIADLNEQSLSSIEDGAKGAEDSVSILPALRGEKLAPRPMFYNDHRQADDPAACAMRLDDPVVNGNRVDGKWKIFFDANLIRRGIPQPFELYDLAVDPYEQTNLINDVQLKELIAHLSSVAERHRNSGGHRLAEIASDQRVAFNWAQTPFIPESPGLTLVDLRERFQNEEHSTVSVEAEGVTAKFTAVPGSSNYPARFSVNPRGVGIEGGAFKQVDDGESIIVTFDKDVIVESVAIVAGNGVCGGFYQVGEGSPLAIYCVDADIDAKDQAGILSDIGLLKAGTPLRLDSHPHYGVEAPGQWRLESLTIRFLK
ncbi:Arylsulfatase [Thalassoglobus neptunius]|uniref:Arylsulfatase n=1 Tax=Thalassoglobus neptunius TaxID=1938619 RepID=A0A5C5W967_9PLAN|nr:arylsulfatase [Thalassoglobus neptunius]TWT47037.1 Arylsulfatase [Thalassoglobus neptunius]